MQRIVILTSAFAATVLLLVAAAGGFFFYLNTPPGKEFRPTDGVSVTDEGEARVEVHEGESAGSVGQRLEDALLIRSAFLWNILSRLDEDHIRQGVYVVTGPLSLTAMRALLKTGRQEMVRITIPEGVTISKTARILENGGICAADDFLAAASDPKFLAEYHIPAESAEGYLFPDTYLFPRGYPARLAVQTMADNLFKHLEEIVGVRGPAVWENAAELHQKITLASIVEREYRVNDEAQVMAGVFYNRLERGMRLQSCATVEYIITEIEGKPHPTRIFFRDLEIQNPYNTYRVSGLPPGPISAPGQVALAAVYHPAATDYLYFRLADADAGRHTFSHTLEDHNNAVVLYTKAGAGQ